MFINICASFLNFYILPPRIQSLSLDQDSSQLQDLYHTPCWELRPPREKFDSNIKPNCTKTWWAHFIMMPSILFFISMSTSFPSLSRTRLSSSSMSLAAPCTNHRLCIKRIALFPQIINAEIRNFLQPGEKEEVFFLLCVLWSDIQL